MRVRQCRLSGRRVPGSGFCVRRTANKKAQGVNLGLCRSFWCRTFPAVIGLQLSRHCRPQRGLAYDGSFGAPNPKRSPQGIPLGKILGCKIKPRTMARLVIFCRPTKLWRRYQIYMKYMRFSSVLQDLRLNLSPFVVNVIALLR